MTGAGAVVSAFLAVVFLVGFYLHADLALSPALKVPAVGALVGGWALLVLHAARLRRGDLLFAGLWLGIALASLALNPALWDGRLAWRYGSDYATSFAVFLASLGMAVGVFTGMRYLSAQALERMMFATLLLLLAGIAAERWLGFGPVSDAVRAALYPEALTYAENLRDRLLYGGVRPKLFTSEPSHIAKFFVLALLVWYATARCAWRVPGFYAILAAGVMLVQSPTMLVALPAAWMADLCRSRGALGWVLLALAVMAMLPVALVAGEAVFAERLGHILSGQDTSFLIRIVLPFEVLARVWADYPLFGLGIGAKESGIPYAIAAAQHLGLDAGLLLTTTSPLGNNGLAIGLIQLGIAGSLAFAASLLAFWRFACGCYWSFAATGMASYMLLIGGINDPRFWGGMALLSAAGAVANQAIRTPGLAIRAPAPAWQ